MKVAAYLRYSSLNQEAGYSIEAQRRAVKEFCERQGYLLVREYVDKAESATTDDRPSFLRMIEESALGMFDAIIVHKLDRFSRDRYDSAIYRKKLQRNGVKLISVLENFDDSPENIMLISVLEGVAEYYSKNLAREVKKGMKEAALKCQHTGGKPPLGYDVVDKKYAINSGEAETVKTIFSMYADGHGFSDIMEALKDKRTKTGKPFGKNSLHDILKNEKYIGVYVFNRSREKQNGKRNHHASKPAGEIIRIENGLPAIIDKNTWERVQKRMASNLHKTLHAKEDYLLSGLIFCGLCDSSMCGNRFVSKGATYAYYECVAHKQKKSCSMKRVKKELIETATLDALEENIFSEKALAHIAKCFCTALKDANKNADEDIKKYTVLLSNTETKISNIADTIADGGRVPGMIEKLKSLEKDRVEYQSVIDDLEIKKKISGFDEKSIIKFIKSHRNFNRNSPDTVKNILRAFVEKVVVYPDKADIHLLLGTDWWRRTVQVHFPKVDWQEWNAHMSEIKRLKKSDNI